MIPVRFFFIERGISLAQRNRLKKHIVSIFKKERCKLSSLNYIFCSDNYLLNINQRFLKHDYYTDIITFEISKKGDPIEGEIYISIDRVRENAKKMNCTINSELHRVIFHGALHLCGYKDKSVNDEKKMRIKEDQYLSLYFMFPRGTFKNQ